MHGLIIESLDPTLNLALEQYLFESLTPDSPGWFLLWHNRPSIIVGRHQNTVQEVNQERTRRLALPVVRRISGGGAVYHDTGNLNFSFVQPVRGKGSLDFGVFLRPIVETLADLGVQATFSSRNDLTVEGRKISGSAQLRRGHGVLHHGTLLVHLDLDMLGAVLTGAPDKYQSRGIASIRSRVANLSEFLPTSTGMEVIRAALLRRCAQGHVALPPEVWAAAQRVAEQRYRTWEWNYGASPAFTKCLRQRFAWGAVECCLDVRQGVITGCRIYGDFFSQRDMAELEACLCGVRHEEGALASALAHVPWELYFSGCHVDAMREFFCKVSD